MDSSPLTVLFDGSHFDLGANSTSSHGFEHHLRYNGDVADTAYSRAMDYTNYGNPPAMDAFAQTNGLNGYIYASTSAHAQGPTDGHDISYATGNGYTNTSTSFPNLTGNHNISYNANNAQGYAQSTTGPLAGASNFSPSTTYIDNGIMNSNSNTNQTRYDGLNANAGFTNYGFGMPSNYLVGAGTYQEQLATFEHDVLTNQGGKAYEGDGNRDEGDIFHQ
ncbi:hypothetical protein EJ08DRAFT_647373 [Tothia fuscella]|uniref:Uncharacterized protein n=1 Tax=Tothia fuscella TaxID=1048955 RepID=A0A9P4NYB7_9PEZI|nr:hypothetical protein EJ08DRAFT_647373 [Tothia fuscella]